MQRFLLALALAFTCSASHADPVTYDRNISAIFKAKCVQCHGGLIPQGGLKLNSLKNLKKGGKSGQVILPGNAEGSLMVSQFFLPESDPKRMPPMGAPQLTDVEIEQIRDWIDAGAN